MSEFLKQQISGAAQAVENTISASLKDFSEGMGSFITGERAYTHDPKPVEELSGQKKEGEAAEREGFLDTSTAQQTAPVAQTAQETPQPQQKGLDDGLGL